MQNKERHKDYFEGILQVRGADEELLEWIRRRIQKDGKANVAKEKDVRGGVDLYISDQKYLRSFGKKLREYRPGILKLSRRLHTTDRMTSKFVYRVSVMFRPINYKKGDEIKYKGEKYQILLLSEKAHLKELKTGKKIIVNIDELIR